LRPLGVEPSKIGVQVSIKVDALCGFMGLGEVERVVRWFTGEKVIVLLLRIVVSCVGLLRGDIPRCNV
jgi:hypothetical protein